LSLIIDLSLFIFIGISAYLATYAPLLSAKNYDLKIKWSDIVKDLTIEQWQSVIFCDEKTLQSVHYGRLKVYRKRGRSNRFVFRRPLNRIKINLFGWISNTGVGHLYVFSNKTKSTGYINYLNNTILPDVIEEKGHNFIWQQDNCPFHASNLSYEYYKRINARILLWSPCTPQFSIIENVWGFFTKSYHDLVFQNGTPSQIEDLIEYAMLCWYSIPSSFVANLYTSIPQRINSVLDEHRSRSTNSDD
jgi:hypothetical protein